MYQCLAVDLWATLDLAAVDMHLLITVNFRQYKFAVISTMVSLTYLDLDDLVQMSSFDLRTNGRHAQGPSAPAYTRYRVVLARAELEKPLCILTGNNDVRTHDM